MKRYSMVFLLLVLTLGCPSPNIIEYDKTPCEGINIGTQYISTFTHNGNVCSVQHIINFENVRVHVGYPGIVIYNDKVTRFGFGNLYQHIVIRTDTIITEMKTLNIEPSADVYSFVKTDIPDSTGVFNVLYFNYEYGKEEATKERILSYIRNRGNFQKITDIYIVGGQIKKHRGLE